MLTITSRSLLTFRRSSRGYAASLFRSLRARLIIGAAIRIAIGVYASGIFIAELFRSQRVRFQGEAWDGDRSRSSLICTAGKSSSPTLSGAD
jgi:hypothetical protein